MALTVVWDSRKPLGGFLSLFDLLGQPIDGLLGFAGSGEDGAFVVLEDLQ